MSDIKKFLDQGGVSTLWSRVAEEIKKVDNKAAQNASDITELKGKVSALEAGTYDDTAVKALIATNAEGIAANKAAHEANAAAIEVLNGDGEGSVSKIATTIAATKVAEIVAGADADFDTLKEIADWILNDTTGAADMANKIAALTALVGNESVATQIANAIEAEDLDKYALASDLTDLVNRVKALEDAGYMDAVAVNAAIESKITALKLDESYDAKGAAAAAEVNAKAYADSLAANYDAKGAAAQALVDAKAHSDANLVTAKAYSDANLVTSKSYTDTEMAKIQALTEAEIDAAIASAKA